MTGQIEQPHTKLSGDYLTTSPEATFELGRRFSTALEGGEVVLLSGDLGTGKTLFTKGLAAGLEIDEGDVTSPTFTLINIHDGKLILYHVDLYRLDTVEWESLGLDEAIEDDDAVIVIEWGERLIHPPQATTSIEFEYVSDNERRITFHHSFHL
jgi:tRNA threonylcarbamoyladenosine biosynthesis protein TsaE